LNARQLYPALVRGNVREYMLLRRGWIDLLASVPLLLLISGPSMAALLASGGAAAGSAGVMSMLKVLKILKQIKNADSVMAQRHVSMVISTAVTALVMALLVSSIIFSALNLPSTEKNNDEAIIDVMMTYSEGNTAGAEMYRNLLIVKKSGETVFTRFDNDYYSKNFGPNDYQYAEYLDYQFFFDYRGMEEKNYNFEVRINPDYKDDDIFILAKDYNDIFLHKEAVLI
jgi:hypothetical protein